jgi:hypothetical protein
MRERNAHTLLVDNPLRKWLLERQGSWKVAIKRETVLENQTVRVNGAGSGSRLKVSFGASGIEPSASNIRELVIKSYQSIM